MPTTAAHGLTYDAFLSYSQAADGKLAPALRQGLHGFAKAWYQRRALHVFQDAGSLSANPDLWGTIHSALLKPQSGAVTDLVSARRDPVTAACAVAGGLSEEQWDEYVPGIPFRQLCP